MSIPIKNSHVFLTGSISSHCGTYQIKAVKQLQELEQHTQAHFPVPDDEMILYYEELITGQVMTDYAKKRLQKLGLKLASF